MAVVENTGDVHLVANAGSSNCDFIAGRAFKLDGTKDMDAYQPVVWMVEPAGNLPILRRA